VMFSLRCLHPPGGASALLTVMGGIGDPGFALYPVLLNSALLTVAGMAYNNATRRAYPHMQLAADDAVEAAARDSDAAAFDADLDAVLARYNQVLDVSRDDLKTLLDDIRMRGYQRQLSNLRCADIMSRDLITVETRTPLPAARALFAEHRIKALPVVDKAGGIVGIVTPADFMRAADLAERDGANRAGASRGIGPDQEPSRPRTVGQIMTRKVRVASVDRFLTELIPLFGSTGHHHIPIIDGNDRLVGIITQTDVVAALADPRAREGAQG
jgi:CBS domain-containing membrane protein